MQVKSSNEAQDAHRAMSGAIQGLAETQLSMLQRLADVQCRQFNQAVEAAREQLRLISQAKDPQAFTSAQANLVETYGQQYLNSVNEATGIISRAWEDYRSQLEKSMGTAADLAQRAAGITTAGIEEASGTTRKGASSKRTS